MTSISTAPNGVNHEHAYASTVVIHGLAEGAFHLWRFTSLSYGRTFVTACYLRDLSESLNPFGIRRLGFCNGRSDIVSGLKDHRRRNAPLIACRGSVGLPLSPVVLIFETWLKRQDIRGDRRIVFTESEAVQPARGQWISEIGTSWTSAVPFVRKRAASSGGVGLM